MVRWIDGYPGGFQCGNTEYWLDVVGSENHATGRGFVHKRNLSETELVAEADRSPGVMLASGYIAGGAIGGIILAVITAGLPALDQQITTWSEKVNPFYSGANADWLALIPFAVLVAILYLSGHRQRPIINSRPVPL